VFGGLVGWVASLLTRRSGKHGIFMNVIFGVVGASLGGWLMSMIGKTGVTDFNWYSFWVAVLGAVILNLILKIARG
jgi:uncharacterized membrane protein YeaQ/YmgE (transglycosylase-associated protein family)